jgi:hypothetical protein
MGLGSVGGKHYHVEEYVYDFAKDGGAIGQIVLSSKAGSAALPVDACILRVHSVVHTALTSGGSATVSVGDVGSSARYLALTAFDNAQFDVDVPKALSTGLPNHVATAAEGQFAISIAAAALTAGKISFFVEYVRPEAA